jgi:hypothetical protein
MNIILATFLCIVSHLSEPMDDFYFYFCKSYLLCYNEYVCCMFKCVRFLAGRRAKGGSR